MSNWKYLKYVVRHKWFVLIAGIRTGAPIWRLLIHDWSKFRPCEWIPYARYFYGDFPAWDEAKMACPGYPYRLTLEGVSESFDRAWLHHQHANKHHWQHWVLRNDDGTTVALLMPKRYALEMLADWMGAGRAITGRWEAAEWYVKNRDRMILHPHTRACVEAMLEIDRGTHE